MIDMWSSAYYSTGDLVRRREEMRGPRKAGERWLIALALVIGALALGLVACGDDDDDGGGSGSSTEAESSEPITIGFVVGKTGVLEAYDVPAQTMAQLAIDDINADGGIDGRKIKTVSADMKSKPELAGNAATDVVSQGADVLLLPCDFDLGSPAGLVAQEQGKIGISLCAASTAFGPEGIGNLAYTMGLAAPGEGTAAAQWAYEERDWRSTYVLLDTTLSQNQQGVEAFKKTWSRLGGKLVGEDTFKQEDQSIDAQVNRIADAAPQLDFVYVSSFQPGLASAVKQIRDAGIDLPIVTNSDSDGEYWKDAVPNLSNMYFTAMASLNGDDPEDKVNEVLGRYEEETGEPPLVSAFLGGFAAVEAIEKAVTEAGSTDGEAMTEVMQGFTEEPFVLETTFTPETHIALDRPVRIMEVQNGKTSFVTVVKPTDVPEVGG
jgi:branched-chain amino acid transport system substrate-binding protein